MAKEIFWTDKDSDPKRNHRFRCNITGLALTLGISDVNWMVEKADRPKFTTNFNELPYYSHTLKYAGRVNWQDVTVTFRDPRQPDIMKGIYDSFKAGGYRIPKSTKDITTISKKDMVRAVGDVIISIVDSEGNDIEKWTLHNAQYGDITPTGLGHTDTEFAKVDIVFKYDFATLVTYDLNGAESEGSFATTEA